MKPENTVIFTGFRVLSPSMVEITRRHMKEPYDIIHVHSVPDFEVFASFVPKLKGAKIILDIHDIVPELYAAKFNVGQDSLIFKALKVVEKLSASFADHVIIANDLWKGRLVERSVPASKCTSLINFPDVEVFRRGLRMRGDRWQVFDSVSRFTQSSPRAGSRC